MTPQHRELARCVQTVISAKGDADIVQAEIERDVRRLFPREYAAVGDEASAAYVRSLVQGALKSMQTTHDQLPGLDLPARLTVPGEGGGFVYRHVVRCTEDDFDAHEAVLVEGWRADGLRIRDYRQRKRRVVRVLKANNVARLIDLPTPPTAP